MWAANLGPHPLGSQSLDASFLARTTAVVRNWSDVFNQLHIQPSRLKRGNCAFATRTRAFDSHFHITHAELGCLFSSLLCSTLTSKRRAFAASFETTRASTGPAKGVALGVCDGDRGVIESCVYVRNAVADVAAYSFFLVGLCHCKVSHWMECQ
jgi:hypothetical protein